MVGDRGEIAKKLFVQVHVISSANFTGESLNVRYENAFEGRFHHIVVGRAKEAVNSWALSVIGLEPEKPTLWTQGKSCGLDLMFIRISTFSDADDDI
jgi:hypothetical protein